MKTMILMFIFTLSLILQFQTIEINYVYSSLKIPEDSFYLGKLDDDINLRVVVGLKLKNEEELVKNILQGKILNENEIQKYLPTEEEYSFVLNSIKKLNPSNITTYKNRILISFEAKKSVLESFFNSKFEIYYYRNVKFYTLNKPSINSNLAKYILGFSGLNNFSYYKKSFSLLQESNIIMDVKSVREFYNISKLIEQGINGKEQTIVIGSVNNFDEKDVELFEKNFNLPPKQKEVHYVIKGDYKTEEETTVDVQWARAIAPESNIKVVLIPDPKVSSFIELYNYIVSNKIGNIVSVSWIIPETNLSKDEIEIQEKIFMLGVAQGINFYFPSGDWGSSSTPTIKGLKNPIPFYPSTSPYVTSVGGTQIKYENGKYYEIAWGGIKENYTYGSGGGYSNFFDKPSYQNIISFKRGFPDVSYNAAQESGYIVYLNGKIKIGYGTSLGAPQWAGINALINQLNNGNIGFINLYLYKIYENKGIYSKVFNDITEGNNGLYNAKEGWDPVTGLGTPNVYNLAYSLISKQEKSLAILTNSSIKIKVYINNTETYIPTNISFKDNVYIKIEINKTYTINDTRYIYLETKGIIDSTENIISVFVNETSSIMILFRKQYLIFINSEYYSIKEWYNANSYLTIKIPKYLRISDKEILKFKNIETAENLILNKNEFTILIDSPKYFKINWIKVYYVKVNSMFGFVFGEGWYEEGEKAKISVFEPLSFLGIIKFKGWKGDIEGKDNIIEFIVDKPIEIEAEWEVTPIGYALLLIILLALIFIIFNLYKKIKSFQI